MYYRKICLTGGQVILKGISYRRASLTYGMSYRWTCLAGVLYYGRTFISERHIWRRICLVVGHVLQEDMSYSKTYKGRYILLDDMSCEVLVKCIHIFS